MKKRDPKKQDPLQAKEIGQLDPVLIVKLFRFHLKQVVTVHRAMFEKLLFQEDGIPVELAVLFEDAGNAYLDISEQICAAYYRRQKS